MVSCERGGRWVEPDGPSAHIPREQLPHRNALHFDGQLAGGGPHFHQRDGAGKHIHLGHTDGNSSFTALVEAASQDFEHRIAKLLAVHEHKIIRKVEDIAELLATAASSVVAHPPGGYPPFHLPHVHMHSPPPADQASAIPEISMRTIANTTDRPSLPHAIDDDDGQCMVVNDIAEHFGHSSSKPSSPTEGTKRASSSTVGLRYTRSTGVKSLGKASTKTSVHSELGAGSPTLAQHLKDMAAIQEIYGNKKSFQFFDCSKSSTDNLNLFVTSRAFELFICLVIFVNAIIIGVEVDYEITHPGQDTILVFSVFNIAFLVIFTLELILRVANEHLSFFSRYNPKLRWNIFDSLLVVSALAEEVLSKVLTSSPDMSAMRLFKTLRLVRGFRLVRVLSFFKDLRVMLAGIVHSLQSLVWAVVLLAAMMYLFAVCVLQFAGETAEYKASGEDTSITDAEFVTLMQYFGGLPITIYTLYMSICGGLDWGDAASALMPVHVALVLLYCFYIAFAVLCVLNIITGVFVENANRLTAQDDEMVMMEEISSRKHWFEQVKELFEAADSDGSGQLDLEEFSAQMRDVRLQSWFRKIGVQVEVYSAQGLFELLDYDGDGKLDLDEFAIALQSVHGAARSIDLAKVAHDLRMMKGMMFEMHPILLDVEKRLATDEPLRLGHSVGPERSWTPCDWTPCRAHVSVDYEV